MSANSVAASDAFAWLEDFGEQIPGKVEIDIEGNIIVTPRIDEHAWAEQRLYKCLDDAAPPELVAMIGPEWRPIPPVSCEPDVAVIERRAIPRPKQVYTLDPPPLLVVEICSPSSRKRDLGEKADLYLAGGAQAYWTIEIPGLTAVAGPELTVRHRHADRWVATAVAGTAGGPVAIDFPFPLLLDLDDLVIA